VSTIEIVGATLLVLNIVVPIVGFTYLVQRNSCSEMKHE
jgi:hypothetical protein